MTLPPVAMFNWLHVQLRFAELQLQQAEAAYEAKPDRDNGLSLDFARDQVEVIKQLIEMVNGQYGPEIERKWL